MTFKWLEQNNIDPNRLDPNMLKLALFIKKRLRNDMDLVGGCTGKPGNGKTTLMNLLAHLVDDNYDLVKHMAFIPEGPIIKQKFYETKKYGCLLIDEAVRGLMNTDWQNSSQKEIVRLYETNRYKNVCTFMIMPRWASFNPNFRLHRINMRIHVFARGKAIVYFPTPDKDIEDPWNTKLNIKLKQKTIGRKNLMELTPSEMMTLEQKLPNYFCTIQFPDWLIDSERNEYDRLKDIAHKEQEEEEDQKENIGALGKLWKDRTMWLVYNGRMNNRFIDLKEAANFAKMEQPSLNNHISRFIKEHELESLSKLNKGRNHNSNTI